MKVAQIRQCSGCRAMLEWQHDDLRVVIPGQTYHIYCPICNATNTVNPAIVEFTKPPEEAVVPPVDDPQIDDEKVRKALAAKQALDECDQNFALAAETLKVSVGTVRNWLKNLPETVSAQS